MTVDITEEGQLVIKAKYPIETYALRKWLGDNQIPEGLNIQIQTVKE